MDLGITPILSLVSGTDQASSVAVLSPDTIYYTLAGDLGVHRRALSTNADTVIFTLPAPPTDVTASRNRLVVVVGSDLHFVNLQSQSDVVISRAPANLHRPALSRDAHSLVAEVAPIDTLTGRELPADLWLWRLP
jgi:hypothetical protein